MVHQPVLSPKILLARATKQYMSAVMFGGENTDQAKVRMTSYLDGELATNNHYKEMIRSGELISREQHERAMTAR